MDDKATLNVVVHKAALQLRDGETLNLFSQAICAAFRDHATQKLNLTKNASIWMAEVMSDKVVASVYDWKDGATSSSISKYYSSGFTRDAKTGIFSFDSDLTEVKPITSYVPTNKPDLGSVNIKKMRDDFEARWQPVAKSLWAGVL